MAHTVFGGLAAMAWLLLPTTTRPAESQATERHADRLSVGVRPVTPVGGELFRAPAPDEPLVVPPVGGRPTGPVGPGRSTVPAIGGLPATPAVGAWSVAPPVGVAAPADDEGSGTDLILPVAAAGTAVAVAAYSLVRRRRRAQLRTTPTGTFEPPTTPLPDLHRRAQRLLVETDDSVRTSTEELRFAAARPGRGAAEPPVEGPTDREDAGRHEESPASPAETEPSTADPASPASNSAPKNPVGHDEPEPPTAHPADPSGPQPHPEKPPGAESGGPLVESPVVEGTVVLDPAMAFAETPAARDAVQPFVEALADARGELVGACRAALRLEEERDALSPDEERALLAEILVRCTTAQRRLDTATPAFDQLRALERDIIPALEYAESRFRELTGRTATATTTLTALRDGYAPAASLPVTGHVEQAKDRLVFATTELNRARQAAYPGDLHTAAVHLRAAEGAIDQADMFVTGVERLAAELAHAAGTVEQRAPRTGSYDDPLDVLRRQGHWLVPARSAVATAADFLTTHRGAVGARARTRLWEAERHLARAIPADSGEQNESDGTTENTRHTQRAHALAQEARHLAEQDVRAYGNPYGGPVGDGLAGALLGGIILGEAPDGDGRADLRGPACYGGTATRARRTAGGQF
ncbi:hypothetical protein PV726_12515 [Streptomyces europaeiscabiei]|uniref:hypothetical protein n=1 Tax=Streptomyces europaeiscabiei TaxID=146819 RepID=UPI0029A2E13D|nr:hypothetical protein [Streptomyces europaeiscabiei]MDX3691142.1 hypothetical protein [Streptomyces europaeiscabiei]